MKWWLISDETVQNIREGLAGIDGTYGWDGPTGDPTSEVRHELDSGLHATDAVPSDFPTSQTGRGEAP